MSAQGVLPTLDWAAEQVRGRHVCASDAERRRVDAGIREVRATVAEYERVLSRIANKEGEFHDDNEALDRYADEARTALARAGGARPGESCRLEASAP